MNELNWPSFENGSYRTACPACGRNEREKTLGITIEPGGKGVAHCFRCGHIETNRPDSKTWSAHLRPIQRKPVLLKREVLSEYGLDLWSACEPLSGAAVAYLKARRCVVPPADGDLRWHPDLRHPTGERGPALVALITHVESRRPLSLHRTWVRPNGQKAALDPPRLLLANHAIKDGVIRLWPDECVTYGLAVAEGIETALSLAWAYRPVWSCIDAGHLAAFPVLSGIETLVIGADNDPAGQKAADECATRWASTDAEVLVTQQAANDLNDVLQGLAA